ncbi:MAG: peptide chain release factor N(5)-glutamine methyltransferase [Candidatus Obscuribacterales bacterium]|nr:peptide chain release factor N(5)-glutamine methyltransferase [Candidatus Obscuribacterales bacterium]
MLSFSAAAKYVSQELERLGIDQSEAKRESELILVHVTALSLSQILAFPERNLSAEQAESLAQVLARRKKREPLQYILGQTFFWALPFKVLPGVFIPRADTESVVESALALLSGLQDIQIAEIGVGSGAISISLLSELKEAQVNAVELSAVAYETALANAELNGVSKRFRLVCSDWRAWAENLPPLDVLIANPPYIPASLAPTLAPEVALWEPAEALYGIDEDGLGFYREIARLPERLFKPTGFVVLEFGDGQATAVESIFRQAAWTEISLKQDLAGNLRVLTASKNKVF